MREAEWTHLQTFLTLARTHRLAAAGRRLRADHTTVSRHIASLESALSVRLFDRREDGFYLTSEGERLFEAAEQMESLMLDARNDIVGKDLSLAGTVRIGVPDGLGIGFLACRLARLAASHPGLNIEVVALARVFNLSKREADIAISLSRPTTGRLVSSKIIDYNLRLYAAKSYLETHHKIEKAADLLDHTVVGYIEDLTAIPELNFLDQIHPTLKPAFASSAVLAQMQAICGGVGIGVLPSFLARTRDNLELVLPDCVTIRRTFWLNVHVDLQRLTRIRLICKFITEQMQSKPEFFA